MSSESVNIVAVGRKKRLLQLPDGKHVELWPLTIGDWAFLEEEAVAAARRELIQLYVKNIDLIPVDHRQRMIEDAFKRAESISAETFPTKRIAAWHRTFKGNVIAIWLSMKHALPGLTYDQASDIWSEHADSVKDAADVVAEISRPTLGNGSPPQTATSLAGASPPA